MLIKQIMKQQAPLSPRDQRSLCRSTRTIVNRIDRVSKCIRDGVYEDSLAHLLPQVQRELEEMRKQREVQLAYLLKWGTRTARV